MQVCTDLLLIYSLCGGCSFHVSLKTLTQQAELSGI